MAIGETPGDPGGDRRQQWPGRHQEAGLNLVAVQHRLEEERQRDEREALRRERANRGRDHQRERRPTQEVHRQDGCGVPTLAANEKRAKDDCHCPHRYLKTLATMGASLVCECKVSKGEFRLKRTPLSSFIWSEPILSWNNDERRAPHLSGPKLSVSGGGFNWSFAKDSFRPSYLN